MGGRAVTTTSTDLLDTEAVARLLGVATASVRRYRMSDRPGPAFPAPAATFGASPVWRRSDVEAWVASRPGRGNRTRP